MMNALLWFLRGVLFVILLGLAIKNSSDVELRFYFDTRWQVPLSIVVLISLVTGAVLGLLAFLPQVFRQRRIIAKLERKLAESDKHGAALMPDQATG